MKTTQTIELSEGDLVEAVRAWLAKNAKPKTDGGDWTVMLGADVSSDGTDVRPKVTASRVLP